MMNSNPMNFTAVPFYESANLSFSAGFALDTERNVLFVCRADPATFGDGLGQSPPPDNWTRYMSGIHIVDMDTKTVIDDYDLQDYNVDNDDPMYHLCNDIAIDSKVKLS